MRDLFSNIESRHLVWDKLKRKNEHLEWDGRSNFNEERGERFIFKYRK